MRRIGIVTWGACSPANAHRIALRAPATPRRFPSGERGCDPEPRIYPGASSTDNDGACPGVSAPGMVPWRRGGPFGPFRSRHPTSKGCPRATRPGALFADAKEHPPQLPRQPSSPMNLKRLMTTATEARAPLSLSFSLSSHRLQKRRRHFLFPFER